MLRKDRQTDRRTDRCTDEQTNAISLIPHPLCGGGLKCILEHKFVFNLFYWFYEAGFVLYLTLCYFVLVFFSPFSIAITSLGEERANLSAFFFFFFFFFFFDVRLFGFVCFLFLGVVEGLRFVFVALPGIFSYLFLCKLNNIVLYILKYILLHSR